MKSELTGTFTYTAIPALTRGNTNIIRRDNSDIIKVGSTYYVWYSYRRSDTVGYAGDKGTSGYYADIWYATSEDGYEWTEKGLAVGKGGAGEWDEQSVFTPGVLAKDGRYYIYYTAVPY